MGLCTSSLVSDSGLRVHDIFGETDLAVMHGYPMYESWARSPLDSEFVPFITALTHALSGKPTLMEELGGPTAEPGKDSGFITFNQLGMETRQFMASDEDLAEHLGQPV